MGSVADLIADGSSAMAQLIILMVALIFGAIGGLMLLGEMTARKGRPVRARIVALRKSSDEAAIYYPVYEYTGQNGELIQAESDWGSSGLGDKDIGRTATIYIDPARPNRARTTHAAFKIIGAAFLIGAAAGIYSAFTVYSFTPFSGILLVTALAVLAYKFSRILKPKHLRETKEQFTARIDERLLEERGKLPLLGRRELIADEAKLQRTRQFMTPLSLMLALGLFYGSYLTGQDMLTLTRGGVQAQGELTGYESRTSDGETHYAPIVRYRDSAGTERSFTDKIATSRRGRAEGDSIPVLHLPDGSIAIVDRGPLNWGISGGLGLFGLLCLFGALANLRKSQRR